MNRFYRQVLISFVKYLVAVQVLVTGLTTFAAVLQNSDFLSRYDIGIGQLVYYEALQIPANLVKTMPAAAIVATMVTILVLQKGNEIVAFVSLGGKVRNLAIPFLTVGFILSGLMFLGHDHLVPELKYIEERYRAEAIENKSFNAKKQYTDLWLKHEKQHLVHIARIDPIAGLATDMTIYEFDQQGSLQHILEIKQAKKIENGWRMQDRTMVDVTGRVPEKHALANLDRPATYLDDIVRIPAANRRLLSTSQLAQMAEVMENQGQSSAQYRMLMHEKYASAISIVVLILVIFPVCISFTRGGSIPLTAGKALGYGFAYWMLMSVCMSLGDEGIMGPLVANYLPQALFLIVAVMSIRRTEHAR